MPFGRPEHRLLKHGNPHPKPQDIFEDDEFKFCNEAGRLTATGLRNTALRPAYTSSSPKKRPAVVRPFDLGGGDILFVASRRKMTLDDIEDSFIFV